MRNPICIVKEDFYKNKFRIHCFFIIWFKNYHGNLLEYFIPKNTQSYMYNIKQNLMNSFISK